MPIDPERARFFSQFANRRARPMSVWQKIVAAVVGGGVFILALMFSVVLFAVVVTVGLAAWGYLWWKTRNLRKQMRDNPPDGLVIEGVVIREGEVEDMPDDTSRRP